MAGQHLNISGAGCLDQLTLYIAPQIHQQHMRPRPLERQSGAVGIIIIGEDNRMVAWHHAITGDAAADSAGQHHPWQVTLPENTSGRSIAPCASTTCLARTFHMRWRGKCAGRSAI